MDIQENEIRDSLCDELTYNTIEDLNTAINCENSLLVMQLNIRSINANFQQFEVFLETLHHKPKIIFLTETWMIPYTGFHHIEGYDLIYNNSQITKADGTAAYIDKTLQANSRIITIGNTNIIEISLESEIFSAIYRNHKIDIKLFLSDLNIYLNNNNKTKNHYIFGDMNIDILDNNYEKNKYNSNIDTYLNDLHEHGFISVVNNITRPSKNHDGGTCIDHIFLKSTWYNKKYTSIIYENNISDHFITFLKIEKFINTTQPNLNKINHKKLFNLAAKTNWDEVCHLDDVNVAIDTLINKVKKLVKESEYKINNKAKKRKPWITRGLIKSCKTKEKLYKIWRNDRRNSDKKSAYKRYNYHLNILLKKASDAHRNNEILKIKNDNRKFWQFANKNIFGKAKKQKNIQSLVEGNIKITDNATIAHSMNTFYANVGKNLNKKKKRKKPANLPKTDTNTNSLFFEPTDTVEVNKIINTLNDQSAGGIDGVSNVVIKTLSQFLLLPISCIFNKSIEMGIYPDHFKIAVIVPIYKSGDITNKTNYRPISLTSNFAKIFEKLIKIRLTSFMDKNKILSNRQFGFRDGISTNDAIAFVTNFIYNNLDKSLKPLAVFLDLAKAFDTVDHAILLDKLCTIGIRGTPLKFFESYLSHRQATTRVNNVMSDFICTDTGIPQGTVLGPILFNIFINDLLRIDKNVVAFADDTVLLVSGRTWTETEIRVNNLIKDVSSWFDDNLLTVNFNKSSYVTFSMAEDMVPDTTSIYVKENDELVYLNRVKEAKYLGIIIDHHMHWDKHISTLLKKTKFVLFLFYKLKKFLNYTQLKTVYFAAFNSIITYGILGWGGVYKIYVNRLQNAQNRILRLFNYFNNTDHILNIRQTFYYFCIKKEFLNLKIKLDSKEKKSERILVVELPKFTKEIMKKDHYYNAVKVFNAMPINFKKKSEICNKKIKAWLASSNTL